MKNITCLKFNLLNLIFCLSLFSCVDDDSGKDQDKNVNQTEFLKNSAIIISESYDDAKQSSANLAASIESFKLIADQRSLTDSDLSSLKDNLKAAWKDWQKISLYSFGAADQLALRSNVNIFKTDTLSIESSVQFGTFNLEQLSSKDAKGFPALDYLLNSKSSSQANAAFNSDSNRINYLTAVANDIASRIKAVHEDWNNNRSNFESKLGTDVGSSTGMLVNAINQHYEKFFRDNKLGIPLGVRSAGIARPDFCEAVYGGYSVELVKDNFFAFKRFYTGITNNSINGYGLDDYLIAADAADLDNQIQAQINLIDLKINALSDPLPQQIQSDPQAVQDAYNEIQKLIVLLKVDLPSRIGVLITYQDNDGD